MLVTGNCGNLAFEEEAYDEDGALSVELGSIEELTEAMTSSGNHKLDIQVTFTVAVKSQTVKSETDGIEWIIPR